MASESAWAAFYTTLNRLGPRLLEGLPAELEGYVVEEAGNSDSFWSSWLHGDFEFWDEGKRHLAVERGLDDWLGNVKNHLHEILGEWSLLPFDKMGITDNLRSEWNASIDKITLRLDTQQVEIFIDAVLMNLERDQNSPELLVQGILEVCGDTEDGKLIRAVSVPWRMIVNTLRRDWRTAFQISSEKWEELVAAAFDRAGYDEVVLTPRSGDHGRDVIAIKKGIGSIRIIDSVKAYKPGHLVRYDDVRALAGVLLGDQQASKGIVTTTSCFAPGIINDPFLKPLMPYRLELMDGAALQRWLENLAFS
jgi:restriction system protein